MDATRQTVRQEGTCGCVNRAAVPVAVQLQGLSRTVTRLTAVGVASRMTPATMYGPMYGECEVEMRGCCMTLEHRI